MDKSNGVCYDKLRRKIFGEEVELLEVKDIPGYLRNWIFYFHVIHVDFYLS